MITAAPHNDIERKARLMRLATMAAVGVAILLISIKAVAFWITGSVALLGTLTDSVLDGAASLVNLIAVREALKPADREHRFGHGKAEALAGLGQSIFIFISAGFVAWESIGRFVSPEPIENSAIGIAATIVVTLITLGLVTFQRHVVRQTNSLAIEADSTHYRADLLMNMAALAAIVLTSYLGLGLADPVFGLAIAGLIGFSAAEIARNAYQQLMDRELEEADRDRIRATALSIPLVRDVHDLRTRMSGRDLFIQMHLEFDDTLSLLEAHAASDEVHARLSEIFPESDIIIHLDPASTVTAAQRQEL